LNTVKKKLEQSKANSIGYSANEDGLTNFIFVKDDKESKLFSFKGYIYKSYFAGEKKHDCNVYAVIKEDSDNDKKLTSKDKITLFVSDYDGSDLEEVSSEIYSFEFLEKNIFLYTEFKDQVLSYFEYNFNTKTKKLIKKIEQKEATKSINMTKYGAVLIPSEGY